MKAKRIDSRVVDTLEDLAARCESAEQAWQRVLNMDGGRTQQMVAAMWATIYGNLFSDVAAALRAIAKDRLASKGSNNDR